MDKFPMTHQGYSLLDQELRHLKNIERPTIINAIAEARGYGDITESAEYHAACERQSFIEGRIAELEDKISRAEVIDPLKITGNNIKFGATVILQDEDTNENVIYQIVGSDESDIKKGLLSITSPLARALIGKTVNTCVQVFTPNGGKGYSIKEIGYI